jgi:hypothetical protein
MYRSIDSMGIHLTTLEVSWRWFHRAVAAFGMLCGLYYWTRLIGINDGAAWRFDLMPLHWQVASVSLAVLFPFAASGLWMISSWGAVIWFLCAVIEVTMPASPSFTGRGRFWSRSTSPSRSPIAASASPSSCAGAGRPINRFFSVTRGWASVSRC